MCSERCNFLPFIYELPTQQPSLRSRYCNLDELKAKSIRQSSRPLGKTSALQLSYISDVSLREMNVYTIHLNTKNIGCILMSDGTCKSIRKCVHFLKRDTAGYVYHLQREGIQEKCLHISFSPLCNLQRLVTLIPKNGCIRDFYISISSTE